MRGIFDRVFESVLAEEQIELKPERKVALQKSLTRKSIGLSRPSEIAIEPNRVAKEFLKIAVKAVSADVDPEKLAVIQENLDTAVRNEFFKLQVPTLRLNTLVMTTEIKEAGPSNVTRLRLKLVEEAFQWTTVGTDSTQEDRLVTE